MSAVAINQFATPGLGSLMGGRYLAVPGNFCWPWRGVDFSWRGSWMMKAYYGLISMGECGIFRSDAHRVALENRRGFCSWCLGCGHRHQLQPCCAKRRRTHCAPGLRSGVTPVITDFPPPK
jgi:hypothetical protein